VIVREVRIDVPPDHVFAFFTDSQRNKANLQRLGVASPAPAAT
jgi:hypothetical protein